MIFMGILVLFASDDIKYKLTKKVSYSRLHRYRHTVTPSNTENYSKQVANDIHNLNNFPNHGNYRRHGQGKVGQRFSAQFIALACLSLNFCPKHMQQLRAKKTRA